MKIAENCMKMIKSSLIRRKKMKILNKRRENLQTWR